MSIYCMCIVNSKVQYKEKPDTDKREKRKKEKASFSPPIFVSLGLPHTLFYHLLSLYKRVKPRIYVLLAT